MSSPVVLALPFTHRWVVQNSPARRVPSHGTDLLGQRYAIDFVGVDDRHRTAPKRDWRLSPEACRWSSASGPGEASTPTTERPGYPLRAPSSSRCAPRDRQMPVAA